jgi:hypothetical protein
MVITRLNPETVQVKTKTETVSLGAQIKIGSFNLPGAGEFDVAGILCQATNLPLGTVYVFHAEELAVSYLTQIDPAVTQVDDISSTDILAIDIRSNDKADDLKPILKALEPSYLILFGAGATPEFLSSLQLPVHTSDILKVTKNGLPDEGTLLLPLS